MHTGSSDLNLADGAARLDWDLVRTFLALLEHGSLSAAARALHSSQPTVGRQLDALEASLSSVLFVRSPQGLVPTPTALDLAEPARQMASSWATIARVALGHTETLAGTVRITASRTVSTYVLPTILADIRRRWPEIQLELVATDVVQDLLRRDADIALRMMRPTQDDVVARKVADMGIGLYGAASYFERRGHPTSLFDLRTHDLVGLDRLDDIIRGLAAAGLTVERSDFCFRCDDHVAAVDAVAAGIGLGFVAHPPARARGLVRSTLPMPPLSLPVWVAMHQEVRTSTRIRVVADALADALTATLAGPSSSSP